MCLRRQHRPPTLPDYLACSVALAVLAAIYAGLIALAYAS
jgi:hypothetical protein